MPRENCWFNIINNYLATETIATANKILNKIQWIIICSYIDSYNPKRKENVRKFRLHWMHGQSIKKNNNYYYYYCYSSNNLNGKQEWRTNEKSKTDAMIDCIKAKYNQDQTCLLHSVVIHGSNKQIMLHIKNVTNKIAA